MLCASSRKNIHVSPLQSLVLARQENLPEVPLSRTALSVKTAALNRAGKKNVRGQPRQM